MKPGKALDATATDTSVHASGSTMVFDFGDGTTSTDATASHSYAAPGTYTVTQTVTNSTGEKSTVTHSITVAALPQSAFAVAYTGLHVSLTDQATNEATVSWDFGDGSTATGQNPTHDYQAPGTYTIVQTVTNTAGEVTTSSQSVIIDAVPVANFAASATGLVTTLTDQSTSAATYAWDFGDGTTSTDANPTHTYSAPGTYTVALVVYNTAGDSNTFSRVITVDAVPTAAFSTAQAGLQVSLTDMSTSASTYAWEFGDGTTSTDANPTYTYSAPGTYDVKLTVTNNTGESATTTQSVTVGELPTSSFSITQTGTDVTIVDSSSNAATVVYNFGDGSGESSTPSHTYTGPGTYTVTQTVTNAAGEVATSKQSITIASATTQASAVNTPAAAATAAPAAAATAVPPTPVPPTPVPPTATQAPVSAPQRPINPDQCTGVTNAPADVVAALDHIMVDFTNPSADLLAAFNILGIQNPPAAGAIMLVQSPDWTYYEAIGVDNLEQGYLLNCQQPSEIGSTTKMMTMTVILQLHEAGLLNMDDLLSQYLPDYAAAFPYGDRITLRMLANHTSGLWDYGGDVGKGGIIAEGIENEEALQRGYTPDELVQYAIANGTPNFEPGAEGQWSYSNTNYALLGIIIENLTGQKLEDVYQERIFTPLGMEHTFLWNGVPEADMGLPQGYQGGMDNMNVTRWNLSQGWAAGGVISTAEDMTLFIRGLLTGKLFQNADTLALMQDSIPVEDLLGEYGLGLMSQAPNTWGHNGDTLGYETAVAYNTAHDISVVILTNTQPNPAQFGTILVMRALSDLGLVEAPEGIAQYIVP